jgi:hypothetical protein
VGRRVIPFTPLELLVWLMLAGWGVLLIALLITIWRNR